MIEPSEIFIDEPALRVVRRANLLLVHFSFSRIVNGSGFPPGFKMLTDFMKPFSEGNPEGCAVLNLMATRPSQRFKSTFLPLGWALLGLSTFAKVTHLVVGDSLGKIEALVYARLMFRRPETTARNQLVTEITPAVTELLKVIDTPSHRWDWATLTDTVQSFVDSAR